MIAGGRLDRTIKIVPTIELTNDAGETVTEDVDINNIADTPAMVKQDSSADTLNAGVVRLINLYTITIRYTDCIDSKSKIYLEGKWLEIKGIREIGRKEETEIKAVETK